MPKRDEEMEKFRNGGSGYTGTIERIEIIENDEGNKARVEIRHGPKPKRSKSGSIAGGSYPPTSTVCITPDEAGDLRVGQKVRIKLEAV